MSGVVVDLNLTDSGISDDLLETARKWPRHREAILLAIAEDLVGELKRDAPTSSGRLSDTIRPLETEGNRMPVVAGGEQGVDYTMSVIEGSKPHAPGSPNPKSNRTLSRWASRNGYPGGFEGIYWHIYHYGTEGNDFVTSARERTEANSGGLAATVMRNRGVME